MCRRPVRLCGRGQGSERIDVENPNPGVRAGQIHYQGSDGEKYYYDPNKKVFFDRENDVLAPKSVQKLLSDESFSRAIDKALYGYLGGGKVIYLNKAMRRRVLGELADNDGHSSLPIRLQNIVNNGFLKRSECYFFKSFMSEGIDLSEEQVLQRFGDSVGYEISKNTIHIDDYANERSLSVGLVFCREFARRWSAWAQVPCKLVLAATEDEFGENTTFRFYVPRAGENYMDFTNLNDFAEAIFCCRYTAWK